MRLNIPPTFVLNSLSFVHLFISVIFLLIFPGVWIWDINSFPFTFGLIIPSSLWLTPYFIKRVEAGLINVSSPAEKKREGRENSEARSSEFWEKSDNLVTLFKLIYGLFMWEETKMLITFQALWSWKVNQPLNVMKNKFSSIQRGWFQLKDTQRGWVIS